MPSDQPTYSACNGQAALPTPAWPPAWLAETLSAPAAVAPSPPAESPVMEAEQPSAELHAAPAALDLVAPIENPPAWRCRCGSPESVDVPIHNGQSVRRDCARCGRFVDFPIWHEVRKPFGQ